MILIAQRIAPVSVTCLANARVSCEGVIVISAVARSGAPNGDALRRTGLARDPDRPERTALANCLLPPCAEARSD